MGESGAAADENPGDGDGYAVKMLQRLLDVARPKQATSRSLADTLELVVEEWSVHAAKMQGDTYEIVGGEERANAKKELRRGSETKSVMRMVLDAADEDELPQASCCRYCRCRTLHSRPTSRSPCACRCSSSSRCFKPALAALD